MGLGWVFEKEEIDIYMCVCVCVCEKIRKRALCVYGVSCVFMED